MDLGLRTFVGYVTCGKTYTLKVRVRGHPVVIEWSCGYVDCCCVPVVYVVIL